MYEWFNFSTISPTFGFVPIFLIFVVLVGRWWYVFTVLVCILLMISDAKHVFMFHQDIFTICIFTLVSYLLKCFLTELFSYCRVLRVLWLWLFHSWLPWPNICPQCKSCSVPALFSWLLTLDPTSYLALTAWIHMAALCLPRTKCYYLSAQSTG